MERAWLAAVALLAATACSDRVFFAPVDGFAYHEPDARYSHEDERLITYIKVVKSPTP